MTESLLDSHTKKIERGQLYENDEQRSRLQSEERLILVKEALKFFAFKDDVLRDKKYLRIL